MDRRKSGDMVRSDFAVESIDWLHGEEMVRVDHTHESRKAGSHGQARQMASDDLTSAQGWVRDSVLLWTCLSHQ